MLALALIASSLIRAGAVALAVFAFVAIADLVVELPLALRRTAVAVAFVLTFAALLYTLWQGRAVHSLERVALWVEERIPWLHYSLVTSLDPRFASVRSALEPIVGDAQWGGLIVLEWWKAVRFPLGTAVGATILLAMLPDSTTSRALSPRTGDSVSRSASPDAANPLSPIVAAITPPAYSGLPASSIDDPQSVPALVGSAIVLSGRGDTSALQITMDDRPVQLRRTATGWAAAVTMPATPAAVRFQADSRDRWLALEPRIDAVPVVRLGSPARDSVIRNPVGQIALRADATDDFGLATASFELIISSGQGESFSFRTMRVGARETRGASRASLEAAVRLDSLGLAAGDVLHVRAVASDRNDVSGPGLGASETRTLRIARPGEYDSVAVEGAPPPEVDKSLLSQRMLIIAAERLHARRSSIERPLMVSESRSIAADQARLRQRVGELVFIRLEGEDTGEHAHGPGDGHEHGPDGLAAMTPEQLLAAAEAATAHDGSEPLDFAGGESPVVNVNRPLLEAYNAMWQAGSELEQGQPGSALPHMRSALDALQRARAAERVYLRGRPPAVVVDLADARLKGKEKGSPAARQSPEGNGDAAGRLVTRFNRALSLLGTTPDAATDSLFLLRIEALGTSPGLAASLGAAVDALRTGKDATLPLARARRAIAGEPEQTSILPAWGGGW